MAKFKLSLTYEGSSAEEIVEVEADTVSGAKRACERIMEENHLMVERLESLNVYTSRALRSCSLCPYDYRMDFLGCEAILEDDV